MDVHVPRAVTMASRLRMIDVLTAQEDGAAQLDDDRLLQRASELGRILVSQDKDLWARNAAIKAGQALPRHRLRAPASGHDRPDGRGS